MRLQLPQGPALDNSTVLPVQDSKWCLLVPHAHVVHARFLDLVRGPMHVCL